MRASESTLTEVQEQIAHLGGEDEHCNKGTITGSSFTKFESFQLNPSNCSPKHTVLSIPQHRMSLEFEISDDQVSDQDKNLNQQVSKAFAMKEFFGQETEQANESAQGMAFGQQSFGPRKLQIMNERNIQISSFQFEDATQLEQIDSEHSASIIQLASNTPSVFQIESNNSDLFFTIQNHFKIHVPGEEKGIQLKQTSLDDDFGELNMDDLKSDHSFVTDNRCEEKQALLLRDGQPSLGIKARSMMPIFKSQIEEPLIVSENQPQLQSVSAAQQKIQNLLFENQHLRTLLMNSQKELSDLRHFLHTRFASEDLLFSDKHFRGRSAVERVYQNKPLIALTFASPLIRQIENPKSSEITTVEMALLNYDKEFHGAIQGLEQTGAAVQVKRIHATIQKFTLALTENPVGLHFSGHGIENSVQNVGKHGYFLYNQGNCLVFETDTGMAHCISEKQLRSLLESSGCPLKFVFIASCHSEFAGDIFHNAGVEHVICVQQSAEVMDEAAITFAKTFYQLLFGEKMTICKAFKLTKDMLESSADQQLALEAKKFIIKIRENDKSWTKHKCQILGPFPKGTVEDLTHQPYYPLNSVISDDFVGRQQELQEIIADVFSSRLTTVVGMPGIGKSTIAKAVGSFLAERNLFRDGVTFFSLRAKDSTTIFIQHLYLFLQKNITKRVIDSQNSLQEQPLNSADETPATEVLDEKLTMDSSLMEQKVQDFLADKEVLLILDNVENCVRKDGDRFREFLNTLLVACPGVKLLSTSRDQIQNLAEITEKVYRVKELSNHYALLLLEKKSQREFTKKEIGELLNLKMKKTKVHLYEQTKKKVDPKQKLVNLEDHHLCTLLGGHPHAISLLASLLQDRTLVEMYKQLHHMMSSTRFIQNLHDLNPVASLKVSLDASIENMRRERNGEALDLFYLLGLMPGGLSEVDMEYLKPNDDWAILAELLRKASLLVEKDANSLSGESGSIKYQLLPFMNKYAESLLSKYQLKELHNKICKYFLSILKTVFRGLKVESERARQSKLHLILLDYETNIWSCIYRIVDMSPGKCDRQTDAMVHSNQNALYSSADEYEAMLIGDVTTDAGEQSTYEAKNPSFGTQKNINSPMQPYGWQKPMVDQEVIDMRKKQFSFMPHPEHSSDKEQANEDLPKSRRRSLSKRKSNKIQPKVLIQKLGELGVELEEEEAKDFFSLNLPVLQQNVSKQSSNQSTPSKESKKNLKALKETIIARHRSFLTVQDSGSDGSNESDGKYEIKVRTPKRRSHSVQRPRSMRDSMNEKSYSAESKLKEIAENPNEGSLNSIYSNNSVYYQSLQNTRLDVSEPLDNTLLSCTPSEKEGGKIEPLLSKVQRRTRFIKFNSEELTLLNIPCEKAPKLDKKRSVTVELKPDNMNNFKQVNDKLMMQVHSTQILKNSKKRAYSVVRDMTTCSFSDFAYNYTHPTQVTNKAREQAKSPPIKDAKTNPLPFQNQATQNTDFVPGVPALKFNKPRKSTFRPSDQVANVQDSKIPTVSVGNGFFSSKLIEKANRKSHFSNEKEDSDDEEKLLAKKTKRLRGFGKDLPASTLGPTMATIMEVPAKMSMNGKLIVYFAACKVLTKQYTEALRVINLVQATCVQCAVTKANLLKLQGLTLVLARHDKLEEALKCFEVAGKKFGKLGNKQTANLGVAQCLAAEGFVFFYKATFLTRSDEATKLFNKSVEKFEQAKTLFKMRNHLAGQAYCTKNLCHILKKQGQKYIQTFKELKDLQSRLNKGQQPEWIYRYDGDEISLLIQIVDFKEIMSTEKLAKQKAISKQQTEAAAKPAETLQKLQTQELRKHKTFSFNSGLKFQSSVLGETAEQKNLRQNSNRMRQKIAAKGIERSRAQFAKVMEKKNQPKRQLSPRKTTRIVTADVDSSRDVEFGNKKGQVEKISEEKTRPRIRDSGDNTAKEEGKTRLSDLVQIPLGSMNLDQEEDCFAFENTEDEKQLEFSESKKPQDKEQDIPKKFRSFQIQNEPDFSDNDNKSNKSTTNHAHEVSRAIRKPKDKYAHVQSKVKKMLETTLPSPRSRLDSGNANNESKISSSGAEANPFAVAADAKETKELFLPPYLMTQDEDCDETSAHNTSQISASEQRKSQLRQSRASVSFKTSRQQEWR